MGKKDELKEIKNPEIVETKPIKKIKVKVKKVFVTNRRYEIGEIIEITEEEFKALGKNYVAKA